MMIIYIVNNTNTSYLYIVIYVTNHQNLGFDWWVVVIVHTNHEATDAARI
jgi:hypothetical protein